MDSLSVWLVLKDSRYYLAGLVCILLLVGFLANSISSYYVSKGNIRQTIRQSSLPLTSDNIYSVIQRDLLRPIFISSMMANDAFMRDWVVAGEQNVDQLSRYLGEILREYETVTSFFVSEKTRNYYYPNGILKQVKEDEPRDEWYFRVRKMEEPFEINVDPDLANQDALTIFINYRVFDFEGNYIGATGMGLTVNKVNLLIEEYEERFEREIFFCDLEGNIVLSPIGSELSRYGSIKKVPGLKEIAEQLLDKESHDLTYKVNGDTYFLNSRFVPELDWYLVVEQTEDRLLAPLRRTLWSNLLMALIITVVVAVFCVTTIRRHQQKLEGRNQELKIKNEEIENQRKQLAETAEELSKVNRALESLNREKDEFLGIVAHDLRNPLSGVLGFCEELRLKIPEESTSMRDDLIEIRNSGLQMLELINDILNVASIEEFQKPVTLESVRWNGLVEQAFERFRGQAIRKQIHLKMDLDERADISVPSRVSWMHICLNNLLSNAIKYAPPHSTVTIKSAWTPGFVELSVSDQGPGLSSHDQTQLFEKFVRLSARPTGGESSTGLGLYIVHKMCQRLGASVEVDSELGTGSTFTIRQPLNQTA